jgi:ubiquinone biosynthesis protein
VGEKIHGRNAADISMAELLGLLFEITGLFDMATRTELVLLQKTLVVVEGVARSLNPHFNMWETSEPVLREWIERNLGPVGRIEGVGRDAMALLRSAQQLPELVTRGQHVLARLEAEIDNRAASQARPKEPSSMTLALWIIALALVVLAIGAFSP